MDGDGLLDLTIDPKLLCINTAVTHQPCACGRSSCDYCYSVSPHTPLGQDDLILSPSFNSPLEYSEYGSAQLAVGTGHASNPTAQAGSNLPTPTSLSPSTLRVPQSTSRPTTPNVLPGFMGDTYTPGYSRTLQFFGQGTLPTPESTIPSIVGDSLSRTQVTYCKDFLGKNRRSVMLEYDVDFQGPVLNLVRDIDQQGFRTHTTDESGGNSAISALQKSLSFYLPNRTPPMEGQLRISLNCVRVSATGLRLDDQVTPQDLKRVLDLYGSQTNEQFQLGVIVYDPTAMKYRATIERALPDLYAQTLWLFYDGFGSDTGHVNQWSAILPVNPDRQGSYAAAAAAVPPPAVLPVRTAPVETGPQYLSSSLYPAPRASTPIAAQTRPHSPIAVRQRRNHSRAGRMSLSAGPIPAPLSGRNSRAPSESGSSYNCQNCSRTFPTNSELLHHLRKYDKSDKPHGCWCGKAFRYPKDLKRHQTSHSSARDWRCTQCEKSFTRKDNLQRHVKDEHAGFNGKQ